MLLRCRGALVRGARAVHCGRVSEGLSVMVVEDDPVLREVIALHLGAAGCEVRAAGEGDEALRMCAARLPAVLVLDVMLPGRSGLEVCAALRATWDPSPGVVLLTARGEEADVLEGLGAGADDYVIKPCRPREVVARVQALARRLRGASGGARRLSRGALCVDLDARTVTARGATLRLTATEFALLAHLARSPGVVHPRMDLLREVWDSELPAYARNVDCHVTRLRRKLEAAGVPGAVIESVHGVGYRFTERGAG